MLGHVEFDFLHKPKIRWAVCQPTLAQLSQDGGFYRAVLCGHRTELLLEKVQLAADDLGCVVERLAQLNNPDAIFIRANELYKLNGLAESLGLGIEPESAERLAQCLPHLDDYLALCLQRHEPQAYGTRQLDVAGKKWVEVEKSAETGLFEYAMADSSKCYCLKWNGIYTDVPRDIGVFALMHRLNKSVLTYDKDRRTLIVPRFANLPALFARSATLCTGLLPAYNRVDQTYLYQNVTPSVAYSISTKLKQEALA